MKLALLKGEATHVETEIEGVPVSFDVEVISTAQQARLISLAAKEPTVENRVAYMTTALGMAVRNLIIDGEEVDAAELAKRADLSHQQTFEIIAGIVAEADKLLFAGADLVGKSDASPEG